MRDNGAGTGLLDRDQEEIVNLPGSVSELETFSPSAHPTAVIPRRMKTSSSVRLGAAASHQSLFATSHLAPSSSSIHSLKERLKNVYATQPGVPLLMHEDLRFAPQELYVELELVAGEKEKKRPATAKERPDTPAAESEGRLTRRREFAMNPPARHAIGPEQLFKAIKDQAAPKRVWLEGAAGVGKTTLCKYLAYRWATSTETEAFWAEFELVIYLPLREIVKAYPASERIDDNTRLLEIFLRGNWGRLATFGIKADDGSSLITDEHKEALCQFIKQSPNKVLFLLDGYDEVRESHQIITTLIELLPCYLLTSRPQSLAALEEFSDKIIQRQVENIGFSVDHVEEYINKYFARVEQSEKASGLKDWLKLNPNLQGLIQIPLNCQLMCSAWEMGSLPNNPTITQLYDILMLQWQKRALWKAQEIPSARLRHYTVQDIVASCQLYVETLGEVALRNLERRGDVLIEGRLIHEVIESQLRELGQAVTPENKINFAKKMIDLGIIKAQGLNENLFNDSYEVIHLTFLEYLAADCLARGFAAAPGSEQAKRADRLLRQHQFSQHFNIVWRFVAGRLSARGYAGLKDFFFKLFADPADLLGLKLVTQAMYCLEESGLLLALRNEDQTESVLKLIPHEFIKQLLSLMTTWVKHLASNESVSFDYLPALTEAIQRCTNCSQALLKSERHLTGSLLEGCWNENQQNNLELLVAFIAHESAAERKDVFAAAMVKLSNEETFFARLQVWKVLEALIPCLGAEQRKGLFAAAQAKFREGGVAVRYLAFSVLKALIPYGDAEERHTVCSELMAKLYDEENGVRFQVLSMFGTLIPYLDEVQRDEIFTAAEIKLSDKESEDCSHALGTLEALIPHVSAEERKKIFAAALAKLSDRDRSVRFQALSVLKALIPHADAARCNAMFVAALARLSDKDVRVRFLALRVLVALIPYLDAAQHIAILAAGLAKLVNKADYVHIQTREVLKALIIHGGAEERKALFTLALAKFDNEQAHVRFQVLSMFEALIPYLDAAQRKEVVTVALAKLDSEKDRVSPQTLSMFEALIPYLDAAQRKEVFTVALAKLDSEKDHVPQTLSMLEALIPSLDAAQRKALFAAAVARLDDEKDRDRSQALSVLEALIPSLDAAQRKAVCAAALAKLSDEDNAVRSHALNALEAMIKLGEEDDAVRSEALRVLKALSLHGIVEKHKTLFAVVVAQLGYEAIFSIHFEAYEMIKDLLLQLNDNDLLERLLFLKAEWAGYLEKNLMMLIVSKLDFFQQRLTDCDKHLRPRMQAVLLSLYGKLQPTEHMSLLRNLRLIITHTDLCSLLPEKLIRGERNRLGGQFLLDERQASVCLLHNARKRHAILVIESMIREASGLVYQIEFADLIYNASLRQVEIRFLPLHEEKLSEYRTEAYPYKGWQITHEQLEQLKTNIESDRLQQAELRYNLMGNGSVYQIAFPGRVYHNCLSWAEAKIADLGLSLAQDWMDIIVVDPRRHLPVHEEVRHKPCVIM